MKIVVLDGHPLSADGISWGALKALGEVEVYDRSTEQEVLARSRDASVLITNKAPVTAGVINQAAALRFIAVTATGYDCVDIAAAAEHSSRQRPRVRHALGGSIRLRSAARALPSCRTPRPSHSIRGLGACSSVLILEDATNRAHG